MSNSPSDKSTRNLSQKTKEALIAEVGLLRRRLAELEEAEEQRRHAGKDLAEREKRFADIAENAQGWIWETDAEGKYTYSSPVIERVLGYAPEEVLGKYFSDLFLTKDRRRLKRQALKVLAKKRAFKDFVNPYIHKDGRMLWISTNGIPILDAEGNFIGYRGANTDVTERKRMEQEIRETNTQLEAKNRGLAKALEEVSAARAYSEGLIGSLTDNLLVIDISGRTIADVNEPFLQTYDLKREDVIGRKAMEVFALFFDANNIEKSNEVDLEAIISGQARHYREFHVFDKSGNEIVRSIVQNVVRDAEGNPKYLMGLSRDITKYKQMEQEIGDINNELGAKNQELSSALWEVTQARAYSEGIIGSLVDNLLVVVDLHDGSINDVNDEWLQTFGFEREQVVGKFTMDVLIPMMDEKFLEETNAISLQDVVDGILPSTTEQKWKDKYGNKIDLLTSNSLVRDADGNARYLVALSRDITERKRMEEELRLHRDHLEQLVQERTRQLTQVNQEYHQEIEGHRQVAAALRESEQRHRTLIESMDDLVFELHPDGRFIRYYQPFREDSLYIPPTEFLGKSVSEVLPPDVEGLIESALASIVSDGESQQLDYSLEMDGKPRWFNAKLTPVKDEQGGIVSVTAVCRDITNRKRIEDLQKLKADLLTLLNRPAATMDILRESLDLLKQSIDFEAVGIRLVEGDDYPYFETRGFPQDFVRMENHLCSRDSCENPVRDEDGKPVLECMCGTVLCGRTDASLAFFTHAGTFWTNSTTALLRDTDPEDLKVTTRNQCNRHGYESVAIVPIRSEGEIIGLLQFNDSRPDMFTSQIIGFLENIGTSLGMGVGRIRILESLRNSESQYRAIFEQSTDSIILIDSATFKIVDFNDSTCENLGYSRDEFRQLRASDVDGLFSVEEMVAHMRHLSEKGSGEVLTQHRNKQGELRDIMVSGRHIVLQERGLLLCIMRDITELKRQNEMESRARELEKVDRLRSALLASVSHELRTPLTVIKGIARSLLLTDVHWDEDTRQDFLQTIDHESGTLTRVVENLEKMAQLEAGIISMNKRRCRVSDIVTSVSGRLREITREHRLEISLKPRMPQVTADPDYIQDVLVHLISNAVLFSDAGVPIRISAGRVENRIIVSVTDEGDGIPAEHVEHVFDRFHRVESGVAHRRGGTGLGLSICKAIIERHKGEIWVESEFGKGSTFSFSLPVFQDTV